jgi:alkylhydroperoxidase family enzyme
MSTQGGRYAVYTERLIASVTSPSGHTRSDLRQAAMALAARLGGGAPEARGSGPSDAVPPVYAGYLDKVARHAYRVSDADVAALQRAGLSDDAIFEVTIAGAVGAALGRLERGLQALRGEEPD